MTSLHAYLSYRDAPAALDWLQEIGFEIVSRQDGEEGTVLHSEVRLGNVVLMVSSMDDDYVLAPLRDHSTCHGLYLAVDDVGAIHSAAIAGGALEVLAPERTEWGTERSRVLDPEGYEWFVRDVHAGRNLVRAEVAAGCVGCFGPTAAYPWA